MAFKNWKHCIISGLSSRLPRSQKCISLYSATCQEYVIIALAYCYSQLHRLESLLLAPECKPVKHIWFPLIYLKYGNSNNKHGINLCSPDGKVIHMVLYYVRRKAMVEEQIGLGSLCLSLQCCCRYWNIVTQAALVCTVMCKQWPHGEHSSIDCNHLLEHSFFY